ncbi:MAG: hypothetical protein QOD56_2721 [Gammaproteobacteria bacterium]|jgi:hypothetical protein|nr:hypothetical protein [Gammaproteobacteria bacterium]
MIRRALLLLTLAGIYMALKRGAQKNALATTDHAADAQWANEGGANAPASV